MKKNNVEVIFEALGEIDDEILQQAFSVDDKKAFDAVKNDGQQKSFVVFTSLKRVAAACLILGVVVLSVTVGVRWFSFDKNHNDVVIPQINPPQSQTHSESEESTEVSVPEVVEDDTSSAQKPQTPSQSVDTPGFVESSVSENSTASSSNSKAPSTNPQSSIADNINSVPGNGNTDQEMPPVDNAKSKLFDNVNELKSWLKSSEAKNNTNLKSAVTFFSEKGLIVPTAPVEIKNVAVYSNSMTFFFNDNINNVRLNNIQVFQLVNNQLDYVDKGIFKYFSDYLKKPLDKEVVVNKEDGETESIWYNTTNVSINGKTVECVKITTNREDPEEVYHIIYGNCRISFSVEPVDKAGKVDTSSVLKQIQLETVAIK